MNAIDTTPRPRHPDGPTLRMVRRARVRRYVVPLRHRAALASLFGVPEAAIDAVRVIEHSRFARLHGPHTVATTRRDAIYLRGTGEAFIADPLLVLHEYFHVLRQWNSGALTSLRYVHECLRRGYAQNRYEVEACAFAREKAGRMRSLLQTGEAAAAT
jgi:hypothetical protein